VLKLLTCPRPRRCQQKASCHHSALRPSADDIAITKLYAWREEDQAWLREALHSGIVTANGIAAPRQTDLPADAPESDEIAPRPFSNCERNQAMQGELRRTP
jgi:hypothetical protein